MTALAVAARAVEVLATVSFSWTAPDAVVEAAAMETTGVVVPVATEMGSVPLTAVTEPPAPAATQAVPAVL